MIVPATYVSVWDGGIEVRSECEWDTEKERVVDVETVDVDVEILEREYIILSDGTEIDVDSDLEDEDGIPPVDDKGGNRA